MGDAKSASIYECFPFIWQYHAQTAEVGIQTPEKSGCERSPADNSLRFLPTDGQTGMYGSPLHRQQCMSPKSTAIARV
jgi:hypothetical protein